MGNKMRICPDCGREWSDKVIFCMGCGARTVVKTSEYKEEVKLAKEVCEPVDRPVESADKKMVDTMREEKVDNNKETLFGDAKKLPESEKLPDIEELILAYIRKVSKDKNSAEFIESVRELVL